MKQETRFREDNLSLLVLFGLLGLWASGPYAEKYTAVQAVYSCVTLVAGPLLAWMMGRTLRKVAPSLPALWQTVTGLAALYVVQKVLIFWAMCATNKDPALNFLGDDNAAWFFLCSAVWLAAAYLVERLGWNRKVVLALSVVAGCVVGYLPLGGSTLCLSQMMTFLPLFLLGRWGDLEQAEHLLRRKAVRFLSLLLLLCVAGACVVAAIPLYHQAGFLTAECPYAGLSNTWLQTFGGLFRLAWYGVVTVVGAALYSVMPSRKLPGLTNCGENWISVYFWLRPAVYFLMAFLLLPLLKQGLLGKVDAVLLFLAVIPVLGLDVLEKPVRTVLNWLSAWEQMPRRLGDRYQTSWKAFLTVYTVAFLIVLSGTLSGLAADGLSVIWTPDGESIYLTIMYYTRDYVLNFLSGLLHGQFVLPQWDFSIGLGNNTFSVVHFNPLFLIATLLPKAWMEYAYTLMDVLQLYLAGVAFAGLMRENGRKEPLPLVCGALVYTFSGFALQVIAKHIYFITYFLLMLPVILWMAERWLRRRKWGGFVLAIFLCLLGGYYYTYMNSLLMALYLILREFAVNGKDIKKSCFELLHLVGYYLLALALSMFYFLPSMYSFFECSRVGASGSTTFASLFYQQSYYEELVYGFISPGLSTSMTTSTGFAAIVLVGLVILFMKRKRKDLIPLRCAVIIGVLFLMFPTVGSIFNGFGYVTNRWTYALALVMAFVVVYTVPELKDLSRTEYAIVAAVALAYIGASYYYGSDRTTHPEILVRGYLILVVTVAALALTRRVQKENPFFSQSLVCILTAISTLISGASFMQFSTDKSSNVGAQNLYHRYSSSAEVAATDIYDDSFYRIDIRQNRTNRFTLTGGYGTSFYWSISDANLVDFFRNFDLNTVNQSSGILGTGGSLAVNALLSVKYCVESTTGNIGYVPYGYVEAGISDDYAYTFYENQYALPLGYTYTSYITESDYLALSAVERQQAILQSVVVPDEDAAALSLAQGTPEITIQSVPYTVSELDGVVDNGDGTYSAQKGGTMTLTFEGLPNSETYLWLDGLGVPGETSRSSSKVYASSNGVKKYAYVRGKGNTYYIEMDGRVYCLGYNEDGLTTCTIEFGAKQTYTIDDIEILCLPVDDYVNWVTDLGAVTLEHITEGNDAVTGDITVDEARMLVLSVPNVSGWTAYVDGEKAEMIRVNGAFCGLMLSAGSHSIQLRYTIPGLVPGGLISLAAVCGLCLVQLCRHKRRKSRESADTNS